MKIWCQRRVSAPVDGVHLDIGGHGAGGGGAGGEGSPMPCCRQGPTDNSTSSSIFLPGIATHGRKGKPTRRASDSRETAFEHSYWLGIPHLPTKVKLPAELQQKFKPKSLKSGTFSVVPISGIPRSRGSAPTAPESSLFQEFQGVLTKFKTIKIDPSHADMTSCV